MVIYSNKNKFFVMLFSSIFLLSFSAKKTFSTDELSENIKGAASSISNAMYQMLGNCDISNASSTAATDVSNASSKLATKVESETKK